MMLALRTAVLCLCTAIAASAGAQVRLPDFGDSSDSSFSGALEREVGEAFMRQVRATMTLVDDPEISEYVQSLGYGLVTASSEQFLGFHFFVVEDGLVNAFAAPGGWVGVNTGLILASDSESELAAVMAHEVSHVTQRHIARQVELGERSNMAAIAGLLAAVAIGLANPEAGQAAAAGVLGSQAQSRLDFSRANEQEADRVGMQLLDAAGYDPAAMAGFFEKLQSAGRYYRQPPEYLSTHPVTSSRIADAQGRARQYGVRQVPDSVRFQMVRAKLQLGREPDNARLMAFFQRQIAESAPGRAIGARYGLALTTARSGRLDEAARELEALIKENPDIVALPVARAEVAVRAGDRDTALAIYKDLHSLMPDNKQVTQSYSEALLGMDEPARVLQVLETQRKLSDLNARMYRIQAEALARLGRTAESQVALAEYHVRRGELQSAIAQLQRAAGGTRGDFYKSSRIEARLADLEAQRNASLQRR